MKANKMVKRTKRNQTCHDESVRRRAIGLEANGWGVNADISGYSRPNILNGSIPDIDATKGKKRRIIEVETPDTRFTDLEQHRNLRKFAKENKKTEFRVRTCGQ